MLEQFGLEQFGTGQFIDGAAGAASASQFDASQFGQDQFALGQYLRGTTTGPSLGASSQFDFEQFGLEQFGLLQFFHGDGAAPQPVTPTPEHWKTDQHGGERRLAALRREATQRAKLRRAVMADDDNFINIILALSTLRMR